jgi:hypothetical protein
MGSSGSWIEEYNRLLQKYDELIEREAYQYNAWLRADDRAKVAAKVASQAGDWETVDYLRKAASKAKKLATEYEEKTTDFEGDIGLFMHRHNLFRNHHDQWKRYSELEEKRQRLSSKAWDKEREMQESRERRAAQSSSTQARHSGSSTGDGVCFIATAAYGSPLAQEVAILCEYRDTKLYPHRLGRSFIRTYERCSPPLAAWIAQRPVARLWVQRWILSPVVWIVRRLMG